MTQDVTRSRSDESKEVILAAAKELFAKRGYRGTTFSSIADAAGFSNAGLIHHYPSKNAVLLAVLASRDSEDWSLSNPQPEALGIGIIDGLAALVAHNESEPQAVAMFSTLLGEAVGGDHPAHEYFVSRYERIRAHITQLLHDGQKEHALASDIDPEALANVLIAVLDGLQYQWLLDNSVDMRASYATLAAIIRAVRADGRAADS
jgi:AcrR family transcriptional regulator